ncbi:MAG TPA: response regulator transcription factor [Bacteroidota bacterium]|nr:response regulator transcription factor [Bacteroidota bacterium]
MNSPSNTIPTTKVFLADGSRVGISRVMNLLSIAANVEVIGTAQNAAQTIEGVRNLRPQVLIMDIELPGMSGIQVLKTLKSEFPTMLVIVLTNASQEEYRKRCMEAGAKYFFDKALEFWKVTDILAPPPFPH